MHWKRFKQAMTVLVQLSLDAPGRNCDKGNRQIDAIVCCLYGLTDSNIAVLSERIYHE